MSSGRTTALSVPRPSTNSRLIHIMGSFPVACSVSRVQLLRAYHMVLGLNNSPFSNHFDFLCADRVADD
jgi:hypothetical protein